MSESVDSDSLRYGYLDWVSWYNPEGIHKGFHSPLAGPWNSSISLTGGIGGSGVLCVFDQVTAQSCVISPLTNFMSTSRYSPNPGELAFGIMGNATTIPALHSVKTIIYIADDNTLGVNAAMKGWGNMLRTYYDKGDVHISRAKDVTLQYLGYTTDNGAYYYYHTIPHLNYQDTLTVIKQYADSLNTPYKYVLLDSWWYFKGANGGISNWTAMSNIFPEGGSYDSLHIYILIRVLCMQWKLFIEIRSG